MLSLVRHKMLHFKYIFHFVLQKDPLKLKTGGYVDVKLLKRE